MSKKSEAEMPDSSPGSSLGNFIQGTKEEFEKVVWPSRQQLFSESAAVLLMVFLSAFLIFFVDKFFTWVAAAVFQPKTVAALIGLSDRLF